LFKFTPLSQCQREREREGKVDILELCDGIIDQHGLRNESLSFSTHIITKQAREGGVRERRRRREGQEGGTYSTLVMTSFLTKASAMARAPSGPIFLFIKLGKEE
jgi:hypothetical protein